MSAIAGRPLPDHTQLPDSDGKPVENFFEFPQCIILTESILPVLQQIHPDGQFAIGQNSGIYWRHTDPPLNGCKAPDWFYVPGVPPSVVEGHYRRSYVMWQELVAPLVIIEIASGDGSEERDQTPLQGKFWIYERILRTPYYAILEPERAYLEVYRMIDGLYRPMTPNERGRYPIAPLAVELGLWVGPFQNSTGTWLRWFDANGNLLLTHGERADQEKERADRLAERLRAMGGDTNGP